MSTIGAIGTASNITTAATSATGLSDNFDTFLTLLTQQLQNQDPLSPLDSNEFVSQLVQFSSVEQQINQNKHLENLVDESQISSATSAVSFIGKEVKLASDQTQLANGQADWTYTLDHAAEAGQITVTNAAGRLVYQADAATEAGSHDFRWDGKDNFGNDLPDGVYTLQVTAKDSDGEAINPNIYTHAVVSGVDFSQSDPALLFGDLRASFSDVLSVRDLDAAQGGATG